MTGVKVQDVAIDRGDEDLGATLVHELGDSRHRQVAYTLTAVSRFRHLYKPDEDPELFVTSIELPAVNVLNTARPAPPAVHATVPAFAGTSESDGSLLRHRRRGGLLRVELSRPWFLSGEGEQLGVVVQQCEIGRDPGLEHPLARGPGAGCRRTSTAPRSRSRTPRRDPSRWSASTPCSPVGAGSPTSACRGWRRRRTGPSYASR